MGRNSISFIEFKRRFDEISKGEYEYIDGYSKMSKKIKLKHNVCGHEFEVVASSFISTKTKCKKCANKIIGKKNNENAKRNKDYKKYIKEKTNGEYELISDYEGYKKIATFKHVSCGNVYDTIYAFFEKGNRCPKCR